MSKRGSDIDKVEIPTKVLKIEVKEKGKTEVIIPESSKTSINVGPSTSTMDGGSSNSSINYGPSTSSMNSGLSTSSINDGPSTSTMNVGTSNSSINDGPSTSSMNGGSSTASINDYEGRYSFDYWGSSQSTANCKVDSGNIANIRELDIGKNEHKILMVRVTYKSEIKDTRFGKVVSCLLLDNTGEIAIVSYGRLALDLYKNWEPNHVYRIENFKIQKENELYPSGSNNELQLQTNKNFLYQKIEQSDCPTIPFLFQSIEDIKLLKRNTRIDLLGILLKDYGLQSNSNSVPMRDLLITDNKKGTIFVTLWGAVAEKFKSVQNAVIAVRKGVVGEFQEKSKINCTIGTLVWLNPTIPEASPLLKWFKDNQL